MTVEKYRDATKRFKTNQELVKELRVSSTTLARMRKARVIEFCRIGGQIRYPVEAVERYLSDNAYPAK